MVEKHFTLDQNLPGPDQWFSSTPKEFAELVRRVRDVEVMMGSDDLTFSEAEKDSRVEFRLSCTAKKDMNIGDVVNENDIIFRRPGYGLPPSKVDALIGKTLISRINKGSLFTLSHIEKH